MFRLKWDSKYIVRYLSGWRLYSSNKSLDDIFKTIEDLKVVDATSPRSSGGSVADDKRSNLTQTEIPRRDDTGEKRRSLRLAVKDAKREKALLGGSGEASSMKAKESFVPSSSPKRFLSSSEQMLSGSPQHFIPKKVESDSIKSFPSLGSSFVSLVGRVIQIDTGRDTGEQGRETVDVHVEYTDPLQGSSVFAVVRCIDHVMCKFAVNNIKEGDTVHAFGTLLPLPNTELGAVICVHSVGGDISVVSPGLPST